MCYENIDVISELQSRLLDIETDYDTSSKLYHSLNELAASNINDSKFMNNLEIIADSYIKISKVILDIKQELASYKHNNKLFNNYTDSLKSIINTTEVDLFSLNTTMGKLLKSKQVKLQETSYKDFDKHMPVTKKLLYISPYVGKVRPLTLREYTGKAVIKGLGLSFFIYVCSWLSSKFTVYMVKVTSISKSFLVLYNVLLNVSIMILLFVVILKTLCEICYLTNTNFWSKVHENKLKPCLLLSDYTKVGNIFYNLLPDIKVIVDNDLLKTVKYRKAKILLAKEILMQIDRIQGFSDIMILKQLNYLLKLDVNTNIHISDIYASMCVVYIAEFMNKNSDDVQKLRELLTDLTFNKNTENIILCYRAYLDTK